MVIFNSFHLPQYCSPVPIFLIKNSERYALEFEIFKLLLLFIMDLNVVIPSLKLLAVALLFEILEIFLCLMLVSDVNLTPPLDMRQL